MRRFSQAVGWLTRFPRAANPTPFGARPARILFMPCRRRRYVWERARRRISVILKEILQSYLPLVFGAPAEQLEPSCSALLSCCCTGSDRVGWLMPGCRSTGPQGRQSLPLQARARAGLSACCCNRKSAKHFGGVIAVTTSRSTSGRARSAPIGQRRGKSRT